MGRRCFGGGCCDRVGRGDKGRIQVMGEKGERTERRERRGIGREGDGIPTSR